MSVEPHSPASLGAVRTFQGSAARIALKRALLGIVLLCAFVSAGAWLMHAGIEADTEAVAAEQQQDAGQPPQR